MPLFASFATLDIDMTRKQEIKKTLLRWVIMCELSTYLINLQKKQP